MRFVVLSGKRGSRREVLVVHADTAAAAQAMAAGIIGETVKVERA